MKKLLIVLSIAMFLASPTVLAQNRVRGQGQVQSSAAPVESGTAAGAGIASWLSTEALVTVGVLAAATGIVLVVTSGGGGDGDSDGGASGT